MYLNTSRWQYISDHAKDLVREFGFDKIILVITTTTTNILYVFIINIVIIVVVIIIMTRTKKLYPFEVRQMLTVSTEERITVEEALNHR